MISKICDNCSESFSLSDNEITECIVEGEITYLCNVCKKLILDCEEVEND